MAATDIMQLQFQLEKLTLLKQLETVKQDITALEEKEKKAKLVFKEARSVYYHAMKKEAHVQAEARNNATCFEVYSF